MSLGFQASGGLGLAAPTSSALGFDVNDTDTGSLYSLNNLSPSFAWYNDQREAHKMNAFVAALPGDTRPWWDRVAEYGVTRAIDNHFGPAQVNKTDMPATFAGMNGRTYSQVSQGQPGGAAGGDESILPLLLAAGALFLIA